MSEELKVTQISELLKVAKGEVVELPGFTEDTTFVARLKRPSMLSMVKTGKIPNPLLRSANKLFTNGVSSITKQEDDEQTLSRLFDIMDIICEESFVEPTYNELKENGIELTDQQRLAVFAYTQRGVKALENFRS